MLSEKCLSLEESTICCLGKLQIGGSRANNILSKCKIDLHAQYQELHITSYVVDTQWKHFLPYQVEECQGTTCQDCMTLTFDDIFTSKVKSWQSKTNLCVSWLSNRPVLTQLFFQSYKLLFFNVSEARGEKKEETRILQITGGFERKFMSLLV